jgi:hypothetical protein
MITQDYNAMSIGPDAGNYAITGFEVWWQTDLGLIASLDQVKEVFKGEPNILSIARAVPVAVSRTVKGDLSHYEVLP